MKEREREKKIGWFDGSAARRRMGETQRERNGEKRRETERNGEKRRETERNGGEKKGEMKLKQKSEREREREREGEGEILNPF